MSTRALPFVAATAGSSRRLSRRMWSALDQPALAHALWVLNVVLVVVVVVAGRDVHGNDVETYWGLADGLRQGVYSYWHFLDSPPPDTLRSPGYPAFLALVRLGGDSLLLVKLVQAGLHLATLWLVVDSLRLVLGDRRAGVLGLALAALCMQQAALVPLILAEIPTAFLLALLLRLDLESKPGHLRAMLRGGIWGLVAQLRSPYLLLPLASLLVDWRRGTFAWSRTAVSIATWALALLPYSLWNLSHHGEFRPIPLQAGAGIFYLGYWHYLLPGEEVTEPWPGRFSTEVASLLVERPPAEARARFDAEWEALRQTCDPSLTAGERLRVREMLAAGRSRTSFFPTYGTEYTRCRERELRQRLLRNVQEDPAGYLANRLYSLPRLLVTGVDLDRWEAAVGVEDRVLAIAPFLASASWAALCLSFVLWAAVRRRAVLEAFAPAAVLFLYGWWVHALVAVQARYVAPARPALVVLAAAAAHAWLRHRAADEPSPPARA